MTETIDIEPTLRQLRPVLGAAVIELNYTVQDADGLPVNLTDATHRCLLKRSREDPDTAAVCAFAVNVATPTTGAVRLTLTPVTPPDPYAPPVVGQYYADYAGDQTQYGYVRIGTYYASHLLILETKPHTPLELMLIFRLPVTRSVV